MRAASPSWLPLALGDFSLSLIFRDCLLVYGLVSVMVSFVLFW